MMDNARLYPNVFFQNTIRNYEPREYIIGHVSNFKTYKSIKCFKLNMAI